MEVIEFAGYQVEVKRRAFQKRLGVSVYPNGRIRVSSNKSLSQKEILKFLMSQKDWLDRSMAQAEEYRKAYPLKSFCSGESYPYLGSDYKLRIEQGGHKKLRFEQDHIVFTSPVAEEKFSDDLRLRYFKAFKKAYRSVAEQIMGQRIQFYSQQMGLYPTAVQFRGQKTIWGSCSPENKISLNFKLIVAPIQVVDYVLIHELAHIQHKNHSRAFWSLVEKYTDHRHFSRDWLREHQFKADFLNKNSELQ